MPNERNGPPVPRGPYVHPTVDPRVAEHEQGTRARAGQRAGALGSNIRGALEKYKTPVAGGSGPPIPALEQRHVEGRTMAQQAGSTRAQDDARAVTTAMAGHAQPGSIISSDGGPAQPPPQVYRSQFPLLLQPSDFLPEEAKNDPAFQHGAGSALAQLQPNMAEKYGVVRQGRRISPQELRAMAQAPPGAPQDFRSGMRPQRSKADTMRDLEAAVHATSGAAPRPPSPPSFSDGPAPPSGLPKTDEEAENQAAAGPGGSAARAGKAPVPPALDEDDVQQALRQMGDFDFDAVRRQMIKDVLKNPAQRDIVEARLEPLNLEQLIMHNVLMQRVPIVPAVFEPTFQSMDQETEFHLKQLLMLETKSVNVTDAYLLDKYAVMTTTVGTYAINGNPLPSAFDTNGDFNVDMFWNKFKWITKRPLHMLGSLGIHYAWFEARVRRLFKAEEIKNG